MLNKLISLQTGNALLTDQKEYLEAGADRYVPLPMP